MFSNKIRLYLQFQIDELIKIFQEEKVRISVSIGIAMYPGHGTSGEALLQKADQALYQAKQMGKNRVVMYSGEQE